MKTPFFAVLAGLLALALPRFAAGETLRLRVLPGASYEDEQCRAVVQLANLSEREKAHDVRVEAELDGQVGQSRPLACLEPGVSRQCRIPLGQAPALPGEYTIVLRVRYADRNGYTFSTISAVPVISRRAPATDTNPLAASLHCDPFRSSGIARVSVTSHADIPLEALIHLALPDEFECATPWATVTVPPGESVELPFSIKNRFARRPCSYPIVAIVDTTYLNQRRSTSASARAILPPPWRPRFTEHRGAWVLFGILVALFTAAQVRPRLFKDIPRRLLVPAILCLLLAYTFCHVPGFLVFSDTTLTGGDTPAHNYLASHLRDGLFNEGRIVSWAPGWWCGFPMFQYYFCLPYVLSALLDLVLPFNIAFKLVSVLGILLLPLATWAAARRARLPAPIPILAAIAMVPFLFDQTHTMWGLNITSTLAGMISASLSLPLMLLFIGSVTHDTDDGVFRLRTVFLLAAVIAGHFFTSLLAGLAILALPFLWPKAGFRKSLAVLVMECGLAFLLMSWWIIPLVMKNEYSVGFGVNWDASLAPSSPWGWGMAALAVVGTAVGFLRRCRFAMVMAVLMMASAFLFGWGYAISPVFVNVRLWPFFNLSLAMLAAAGLGFVLQRRRAVPLAVLALLVLALHSGVQAPGRILNWSDWNYSGMQAKPGWPVFEQLVLKRLPDSPGRLANDLHPANHAAFGSTRAFESVPHLCGKPVLEGGIVNSAIGSLFSYYIQGETSQNSAGLPKIVTPATFNITNATRHLELFNVKHFIARWPGTQEAMAASPHWQRLDQCGNYQLFELTTHNGDLVTIPRNWPGQVRTGPFSTPPGIREAGYAWKSAALQWLYTPGVLDMPFILLDADDPVVPLAPISLSREAYDSFLSNPSSAPLDPVPTEAPDGAVKDIAVTSHSIRFTTSAPGLPHLIKMSHFPNWRVRGADQVYRVTPGFMLVYPTDKQVELYYGRALADNAGQLLALAGWGLIAAILVNRRRGQVVERKNQEAVS